MMNVMDVKKRKSLFCFQYEIYRTSRAVAVSLRATVLTHTDRSIVFSALNLPLNADHHSRLLFTLLRRWIKQQSNINQVELMLALFIFPYSSQA